jgi:Uma2 family endonuclease
MSTVLHDVPPGNWTAGDVAGWLPGFPIDRIRVSPTPGTATEQDILDVQRQTGQICELIDGTLVDKVMASLESMLAAEIIFHVRAYLQTGDLGIVLGADGYLKILPDQVRAPDVSFIRWERFPDRKLPKAAIFGVAPDLAVEVLSENNSAAEMNRKLRDYFTAGTSMVWYVDPPTRTARSYIAIRQWTDISPEDSLLGGEVLPGFELPLAKLFARVG